MALIASIGLFAMLMLGVTYFGYRQYAKTGRMYEQLGAPVMATTAVVLEPVTPQANAVVRIIQQIGEKLPISPQDAGTTRRELIMAGFRSQQAVSVFYGTKIVMTLVFFVFALLLRDSFSNPMMGVVLFGFFGLTGFMLPGIYLKRLIKNRQEALRLSLPDALDLMVVSVEAGLGLDQAIQHVSKELETTHKEISEELTLLTLEMRAGKRRSEALKNLAERTGEPEIQKLMAILVQNDRFGTSMAESLRTHSDFMRVRRRQEAEERAGKVGVKLVFPIFFFILPSMMVVAAGPGLLQVFKNLFPMMKNFKG